MFYYKINNKYKNFKKNIYIFFFYKNLFFKIYNAYNKKKIFNINIFLNKNIKGAILRNNIKNKIKHLIQEYFIIFCLIKKKILIKFNLFNNFKYILCKKFILFFLKFYLK
ncbi:MAG: hypothetical protein V9V01_00190 [Candidatus Shikimatogenerans sp. Tmey]